MPNYSYNFIERYLQENPSQFVVCLTCIESHLQMNPCCAFQPCFCFGVDDKVKGKTGFFVLEESIRCLRLCLCLSLVTHLDKSHESYSRQKIKLKKNNQYYRTGERTREIVGFGHSMGSDLNTESSLGYYFGFQMPA